MKGKFWKRLGKPVLALVLAVCVAQGTGGSAIAATLTELQQEQARLEQEKKENDAKLAELKAELFNLRFQHAINQLENPKRIKAVKKDIARISTIIKENAMKNAQ